MIPGYLHDQNCFFHLDILQCVKQWLGQDRDQVITAEVSFIYSSSNSFQYTGKVHPQRAQ